MSTCTGCGAALAEGARFCGGCGLAVRRHARAVAAAARQDRRATVRAALALGIATALPLLALVAVPTAPGGDDAASSWLQFALLLAIALLAASVAGGLRRAWPLRCSVGWLLLALPAAAATMAVAIGYIALLPRASASSEPVVLAWLDVVVLAPIGEELLCRGAAYFAACVLAPPRAAIVIAAVLFAFLHGLNGAYLLELPHRFAVGLVCGWLRWRSGSLLPPMLTHATHNAIALWW